MKYLGVDFGLRRVGLASSEGEIASALDTIEVRGLKDALQKISQFAKLNEFTKIIVGLPEGKMGQTVLGFVKTLKKKGFDVDTADETLSSKIATKRMLEQNIPQRARRINDATAAAIILQQFLDNQ